MFSDTWAYVQRIASDLKGINAEKLQWVHQYTPWLAELPSTTSGTMCELANGVSGGLMVNTHEPILRTVTEIIGDRTVRTITTVSPFYDLHGNILSQLWGKYKSAK